MRSAVQACGEGGGPRRGRGDLAPGREGTGCYSYSTADAYRDVWRACLGHAKENLGIKDIEKLSGEAVRAFLDSKIDQGVAKATFGQYAAACEKLEVALNRYAEQHSTGRGVSVLFGHPVGPRCGG